MSLLGADVIAAGSPGHSPFVTVGECLEVVEPPMDCAGVYCGEAVVDDCGYCVEGTTGLEFNYADLGCGCDEPAPVEYCFDWDGDGMGGVDSAMMYCAGDVPEGWVEDCTDMYDDGEVYLDFGAYTRVDNGTIEILYSSDVDLYGFQFVVTGIPLVSGATDNPDFQVQVNPGNNQVIGFSISGGVYPAGDGVLCVLTCRTHPR